MILSCWPRGCDMLTELTGRPVLGVLPWQDGLALDVEDSLALDAAGELAGSAGTGRVGVTTCCGSSVVRTAADQQLHRRRRARRPSRGCWSGSRPAPAELADADLVVLPGSRATVADLGWLRERGLAEAITARARTGQPVLGICGGYQMLAAEIEDEVESRAGTGRRARAAAGAGHVRRRQGAGPAAGHGYGAEVTGYEIHHGVAAVDEAGAEPVPGRLPGRRPCGAPPGTARWSATSSGGRS